MTQPQPPGDDRQHYRQPYPPPGAYAHQPPPPNWGPPSPQKPPAIQDEIRRALATTRGKIIALALVVAAIVTIVVVAVVGSKVAFADSGESYDLGHGVHVTVSPPDGWKAQSVSTSTGSHVLLTSEDSPLDADEALSAALDIIDGESADVAVNAVVVTSDLCSDNEPDYLETQGYSRAGDWMITPAIPGRKSDYRTMMNLAVRTAQSCSGYTLGAIGASGTKTGTPSTAATDLVSQIADGQIITNIEIK